MVENLGVTGEDLEQSGPIDYIVVEFPGNRMRGEAFPLLIDLVERGIIRILDLVFVRKDADGSVTGLTLRDLDDAGVLDLTLFDGVSSGLVAEDDIKEVGDILDAGSSAGILVYENVWAAPFATAVRRAGGQLVASGRIPVLAVPAALDEGENAARPRTRRPER